MSSPVWNLSGFRAELVAPHLTAVVDLTLPLRGVCRISGSRNAFASCELLGVAVDDSDPHALQRPTDHYVRGSDLIAVYEPSDTRPIRTHVCWRWLGALDRFADALGFELQVSVQTELLDALPERFTCTRLPNGDWGSRSRTPRAAWKWVSSQLVSQGTTAQDQPGPLLVRPRAVDWSYLELVDPRNDAGRRLAPLAVDDRVLEITERLFPGHLEKGVILRARVRGWLLSRSDDEAAADVADLQLKTAALPLTA